MANELSERLRVWCEKIRRTPVPISDVIPLLQKAADYIDEQDAKIQKSFSDDIEPLLIMTRMILCEKCGNKRCPHATNKFFLCTNSNEPNQKPNVA